MNQKTISVEVALLRRAIPLILDELERAHGDRITLPNDYFWSVPTPARWDVFTEPSTFTIGQLSDIIHEMERIVDSPEVATVIDAQKLADLLAATSELPPSRQG